MLRTLRAKKKETRRFDDRTSVQPLRGELFSIEHLKSHAASLAKSLTVTKGKVSDGRFQQRYRQTATVLRDAHMAVSKAIRQGEPLTPDAEWLLDNFHIVEEHLHEIEDDLPPGYFRELPKLADGDPRTYQLALELIVHTDSVVQHDDLTAFINEFQNVSPLSIGELWALPIMLRLALVENLRRLAGQMVKNLSNRLIIKKDIEEWEVGTRLPELFRRDPPPDLIANTFAVLREIFVDDAAKSTAFEQMLLERYPEASEFIQAEHRRQAANQVSIGNVITSMRLISALDWTSFFEATSLVERTLRFDPAGIYPLMEPESRDRYRHAVEEIAKRSGHTDVAIAQKANSLAHAADGSAPLPLEAHVGYWLVDQGRPQLEREVGYRPKPMKAIQRAMRAKPSLTYFGSILTIIVISLFAADSFAHWTKLPWPQTVALLVLALVPLAEFAVSLVNFVVTHLVPPQILPKLELKDGVPNTYRAFVVVPAILSSRKEVDALLERIEMHYVSNPEPQLRFALLTDFVDSKTEHQDNDTELVQRAVDGIKRLNAHYQAQGHAPFYLLHRSRKWNPSENAWMGWERKRGKLMEFNQLLHGQKNTSYTTMEGDLSVFNAKNGEPAFPFVITLDSDTQLPLGTARRLVGTMAHPLNRPRCGGTSVEHGFSILQPRVSVKLGDGNRSKFTQLFANSKGIDPYATAASDVYQDLFGEGSFTGKGIYDVESFERMLEKAFGENQILSHDLIEGCHARVGLVSDIEVIDGYPARYDTYSRRNHRWARGDWQILPWLFAKVPYEAGWRSNRLSMLSRWKILDNLRRSVTAQLTLVFLIASWFLAPRHAWGWSVIAWCSICFPIAAGVLNGLLSFPRREYWSAHVRSVAKDVWTTIQQTIVLISALPHRAWNMTDAIGRTVYRMAISRRHMLEWETAAATESRLGKSKWSIIQQMAFVPVLVLVILILVPKVALLPALPWLALWFFSPILAHLISQPFPKKAVELTDDDRAWLRKLARNTWSYFETCVNDRTHWLPPDNLQEHPEEKLAERISPTNEGLYLVSALVARDFGFLGLHRFLDLCEKNLKVWTTLPQLQGHYYNWYETSTLQALTPRYISTVDSGNLAASFLVLRQGTDDLCRAAVFGDQVWIGARDTIQVAIQSSDALQPRGAHIISPALDNLTATLKKLEAAVQNPPKTWEEKFDQIAFFREQRKFLADQLAELQLSRRHPSADLEAKSVSLLLWIDGLIADFDALIPWADVYRQLAQKTQADQPTNDGLLQHFRNVLDETQSLDQLITLPELLSAQFATLPQYTSFSATFASGAQAALDVRKRLQALGHQAEQLALKMEFGFLYNAQRRLFSIGFNLEDRKLDRSHYDMLCSEARLSSHLAIAKGDVSYKHWFQLGRQMTFTAGRQGLLSWGGTMFEFLMPILFQKSYPDSLLAAACEAAVARQQEYGRQRGIPWGVSESAFASMAINQDYQYQSFGVPGLGLKRGLSDDLVVAPYATMLALTIDPPRSIANLRRLANEDGMGRFGFYDAVDYTPNRVPTAHRSLPVRCYMAHHQAMGLTAIANLLFDQSIEKRFHAHPLIRATELLLQEATPTESPSIQPHEEETTDVQMNKTGDVIVSRRMTGYETPAPRTHLLSNGIYSVMVTNTGGGYSQSGELGVTRWRSDLVHETGGHFIYIRDRHSGQVWSATFEPTGKKPDSYEVIYAIDKAEYRRRDGDLEVHMEVAVSPDNQVEVRQLKITNHGWQPRDLEITSYAEVTLIAPAADQAHPAFQKLFVETEYIAEETALIAKRRPRDSHNKPVWGVHVLACSEAVHEQVQYESSREKFIGRGRSTRHPAALDNGVRLSGTTGLVLDPIFSLRCTVSVGRHSSAWLAFSTGTAESPEEAMQLADQFHEPRSVQRAFEMAWVFSQVQLHHLHITAAQAQRFQQVAALLLYPQRHARGPESSLLANRQGQNGLWRMGISGDRRMMLVKVTETEHVEFVRELLLAHEYWRHHGLVVDLIILNTHPGSYLDDLQEQLQRLIQETPRIVNETKNSIFLLRAAQMPREDQFLLEAVSQVVLEARRGWTINSSPVSKTPDNQQLVKKFRPGLESASRNGFDESSQDHAWQPERIEPEKHEDQLEFWNGVGGFFDGGREYHIQLQPATRTPMPWSNVIANARFGTLVTESGAGFTWAENSRQNKLTTWSNDPISDPPPEILYLRDDQTLDMWRPFSYPKKHEKVAWVHHGQGYTRCLRTIGDIEHEIVVSIAPEDPVKLISIKLKNQTSQERQLTAAYYAECVLGVVREQTNMHLVTEWDAKTETLLIRNPYHPSYAEQVAFLKIIGPNCSATGDRVEFLGRNRTLHDPAAMHRESLSGKVGAGYDPCAAVASHFTIPANGTFEIAVVFGCGSNLAETTSLVNKYGNNDSVEEAIRLTMAKWDSILTKIQVKTPNRAMDLLVNRWLLYQVASCRFWGRSAFYQSGGAFGFRDQLQDVMALVHTRPELVREQILRAAARQYEAGDVQHWWHPPKGEGTRTRFSDDLLWLPFVVSYYVRITGDVQILDEQIPFLNSQPLTADEVERYELPQVSEEKATLYEHCLRTLVRGFRTGEHGLPLMGCGDWNDGMSHVGVYGHGESVWVGWFLLVLLDHFLPLAEQRGDKQTVDNYRQKARDLRDSIERNAWDGQWYRRAYFDDGTPLGSHTNDECQIDSIAQSWAVLANADSTRTDQAMESVFQRLVSDQDRLVVLFTPPFDKTSLDPGYIKGYLPGVRENGGQYTHAVLWLIQALTMKNDAARAMQLFDYINPINHARNAAEVDCYGAEPYVIAADVYSMPPLSGRAGWSWYTGSASWTYRAALESILGLDLTKEKLVFRPCIPAGWDRFEVELKVGKTTHLFQITKSSGGQDELLASPEILLADLPDDGGKHVHSIRLGTVGNEQIRARELAQAN